MTRERDAERTRENNARRRAEIARGEREPDHGTESAYTRDGCRCRDCRAANTAGMRRRRGDPASRA